MPEQESGEVCKRCGTPLHYRCNCKKTSTKTELVGTSRLPSGGIEHTVAVSDKETGAPIKTVKIYRGPGGGRKKFTIRER